MMLYITISFCRPYWKKSITYSNKIDLIMNHVCSSKVTTSQSTWPYMEMEMINIRKTINIIIVIFFIARVDVFVQTIAKMVCFSMFPLCKTKSLAISRRILIELHKLEAFMESPFSNVYICLMTCTPQSHLRKI